MKINSVDTTSIVKVNNTALSSIVKMSNVTFVAPSPIPSGIVTTGLVMYLDSAVTDSYSGVGTDWVDITYNGNNGTLVNSPTFSSANGGSILFDGIDDYVALTNVNISMANLQDFVWNAWIKTPAVLSGYKMILTTNQYYIYLALYNNQFAFDTRVSTQVRFGTLTTNTWYNVTVVRRSSVNYRYINGVLINSNSDTQAPAGVFNLGRWAYNNSLYFNSNMAVASIYNQSLTATEVLQNFDALKSRYGY